jgi:GNAT superfamily N-acetyltransferase
LQKLEPMTFRAAEIGKDEASISLISSECFGPVAPRLIGRWMRHEKEDAAGKEGFFVAEIDGKMACIVFVAPRKLHLGEGIHVETLGILVVATCSEHRKKGIATSLMKHSLAYGDMIGFSNASLYTRQLLPAHRIYKRLGFRDIETSPAYIKFFDYDFYFRRWLRDLNRYIKTSNIAKRTLQNWDRSIVFELGKAGTYAFRFRQSRAQRLSKPPKSVHIYFEANAETFARIMFGEIELKNAGKMGLIQLKKGTEADLKILRKILLGIWDE